MTELKPALSYDQQIEHLKQAHNLLIADYTNARDILQKVSYYRLSAYGIGLTKENDREQYNDGITLEHIYRLYQFDSIFRNKLIHVIEQIEIQLRTQIAYLLALKYGPEGYMVSDFFIDKRKRSGVQIHSVVIDSFKKECSHQKNAPLVKHHMIKYGGHFPIWAAIELFTFGNLSSLYNIMKKEDCNSIARLYDTQPKHLGSWILALVEIRNICAHYSRLYNMPLKQRPFLYSENVKYRSNKINKIFPALITIKRMLKDDERWMAFETQLEALMDDYKDVVNLSFMGFPEDWKNILSVSKKWCNTVNK